MTPFEALILGLVQGLTEFLPVSSSGHLALTEHLLGFTQLNRLVFFDLICHMGTLGAIFTLFYKEILETLKSPKLLGALILGTLPLFPLVLVVKPLKEIFDRLDLLGFFFILTSLIIWLGARLSSVKKGPAPLDPLYIGLFQALALFPGVSRSGSTISGAQMLGWEPERAVRFSFLLAIPAILGGFTLEVWHLIKEVPSEPATLAIAPLPLMIGFALSYLSGLAALKFLIVWVKKKNLLPFAWYCLALGIVTLLYFN